MTNFLDDAASLYIRNERESCNRFIGNFLDLRIRPFVLRLTGGCLIDDQYQEGLRNLERAITGAGNKGAPKFSGFCLFGGSRMIYKNNPRKYVRGITELAPQINRHCPDAKTLGIVAKVGDLRHSRHGIVISTHEDDNQPYVTIVHPNQHSVLIVQPGADRSASWIDEAKECIEISDYLRKGMWHGLMVVFNGGGVVAQEIEMWARLGQVDPFWRVLLIDGSGRSADNYARNIEFLEDSPTVHVCENSTESIRDTLSSLGALTYPGERSRI